MIRALRIATLVAAVTAASSAPASAQTGRVEWPKQLDCDVTRRAFDNPFSDRKGYWQPRIAWHAEYAAGSLAMGYGLKKLGAPTWLAATAPTIAIGLAPHVRGHLKGYYAINIADWTFDLWNRATPVFWAIGHRDDDSSGVKWKNHAKAAGVWTIGYLATACFASP